MAAPTVTARVVPTGYKLPEGFKIAIAFSLRPGINIWEVEGGPVGMTAAKIDTTTQLNTKWKTFWISALVEPGEVSGTAGYDPDAMDDLIFLCGAQAGSFTVHMPQNTKYAYWGGVSKFDFPSLRAGQFPMLNYTLVHTAWDPVNRVEAGPAVTQAVGT
jgi:hypothetical protein